MTGATSRRGRLVAAVPVLYALAYALPGTGPKLARTAPPAVVAIGVIFGTVTALGAMALILTYRSNRFVNFAFGSMGSLVGVLAIGMYRQHHVPFFVVLPVGVALGAVMGGAVEYVVLRRFRNSSRLVLTVASIGLTQVLGGFEIIGSRAINFVSVTGAFKVPLGLSIDLGVKTLGGDEMLIVIVAPFVLVGLLWFLARTDVGVAVRAAAENESRALLLGVPVRRNTTIVWVLVGGLATLTFILKAPFSGVTPGVASNGPQVLLPALAAAVVARMDSLPTALVAGIGLGILEQVVRWNSTGSPSVINVVFLVVIVGALVLQRNAFSRATEGGEAAWSATGLIRPIPDALRRLPEVRVARVALIVVAGAGLVFVPKLWSPSTQLLAAFAIVWAIVGVSLVMLTGWGGNISLGQFGVVGAGAMVAGNLIARNNMDLLFVLILSGLTGAVVALVIGLPALRIRGLFLAVTTIAFAVALDGYFLNLNNFPQWIPSQVPRPLLFGRVDLENQYTMYLLCVAVLGVWLVVAANLRRARTGRSLIATRDNERAASAASLSVVRLKLSGFMLAGAVAGVAGALHVQLLHSLSPGSYPVTDSITVFSTTVIGGLGSLTGAVTGVLLFRWIESIQALGQLRLVVTGAGLLFVLLALPGGIGQVLVAVRDRALRAVAARRGLDVPEFGNARLDESSALADTPVPAEPTRAARPIVDPILACTGLDLAYGQRQIVFDLDFAVGRGEMVALLGTNGAGKSTLLKGISGLLPPTGGSVHYDGDAITGEAADRTTRRGVSLMLGGASVFPTLTVADNLRMATWLFRKDVARVDAALAEAYALFPVLGERKRQLAGDLSGGEQQMLALAGALMGRPQLLMIDELSLGLAPTVVAELLDVVRAVHARGVTVVIVEQSVNVALELAERAVFMERGQIRFEGKTRDLLARPDLLRSVFIAGTAEVPARTRASAATSADASAPALEVRGVAKRYGGITAVDDVDFVVQPGEIVGVIGHNGAGKTTLMDCISGFTPLDGGTIRVGGVEVNETGPRQRAGLGLGRSFQEARLFPTLTVAETLAVACERHVRSRSILADALQLPAAVEAQVDVHATVEELVATMGLAPYRGKLIGELSTGTRRVVDLACILAQQPAVVLLDEPSSGVAQRETEALVGLLERVRAETGCAMVIIEHDMPLLRAVCDRMVALELGRVIATGTPEEVLAHPRVIESYLGTNAATISRSGARRKPVRSGDAKPKGRVPTGTTR